MNRENLWPNKAQIDQASAGMRDISPFLAEMFKGLVANGLLPDDAARCVAAYLLYKPEDEEAE